MGAECLMSLRPRLCSPSTEVYDNWRLGARVGVACHEAGSKLCS